jgi:hypothetical protein
MFFLGEYDAGESSTSTLRDLTQHLSMSLNHLGILTVGVSCKYIYIFFE